MHRSSLQRRILVVDDNRDAAELLQILLEMDGYEVRTAYDGSQGLLEAYHFHPQVICSDLNMPVMCGFEFAQALRGSEQCREVHLIALTALADDEAVRRARAVGFNLYFTKPLNFERFSAHLRATFEHRETR